MESHKILNGLERTVGEFSFSAGLVGGFTGCNGFFQDPSQPLVYVFGAVSGLLLYGGVKLMRHAGRKSKIYSSDENVLEKHFGAEYKNWKGPFLNYRGKVVPLNIEGVGGMGEVVVKLNRTGSVSQKTRGSVKGCELNVTEEKPSINGVDLEEYVGSFK
ncbi:hypothetical protein HOK51_00135 [Candidatus Woesearchaeota archaeon]|nr:hypothetical protein [Candidatus Woesearchaeota archaeon]MBT6518220.1 hypothetical protein [Candidatus Woesearchaeota archaeon]MBT7368511.1 hypothetical protein [Candidatus Woesearchaeota archaeon]